MEYIVVLFASERDVLIGGALRGRTNKTILVEAGRHTITLGVGADGRPDFMPARMKVTVCQTDPAEPMKLVFTMKPEILSLSEEPLSERPSKRGPASKKAPASKEESGPKSVKNASGPKSAKNASVPKSPKNAPAPKKAAPQSKTPSGRKSRDVG